MLTGLAQVQVLAFLVSFVTQILLVLVDLQDFNGQPLHHHAGTVQRT